MNFSFGLCLISTSDNHINNFVVGTTEISCQENDYIIVALPPHETATLLPELTVPTETRPIINIHFNTNLESLLPSAVHFLGIINGISQWIFRKYNLLSVTISNAENFVEVDADELAKKVWEEITTILDKKEVPIAQYRVLKERRATIAQTPEQNALRPNAETKWRNLFLAGDWTNTGLPATIDGAIQSGRYAAELVGENS